FTLELPEEPLTGYFDERLLSQAITNIVKNAGEAITPSDSDPADHVGKIDIKGSSDENFLIIEIIDNGKGWPKENRHKLLEPYMTTRKKGTGLGLSIVVKVVEDHKGKVELLDSPDFAQTGRGAMVRISLPIKNENLSSEQEAAE
ncbi:MAG: ATP-binding protein, partial [Hyphomicrobiales bacterium]